MRFRVNYYETDRMGAFYNARALEWFERARCEWLRERGLPYSEIESRGVLLPVVEAHVRYLGRAGFEDELETSAAAAMDGKASIRFRVAVHHADGGAAVADGYTVHAVVGSSGKPIRPPQWLVDAISAADDDAAGKE